VIPEPERKLIAEGVGWVIGGSAAKRFEVLDLVLKKIAAAGFEVIRERARTNPSECERCREEFESIFCKRCRFSE